MPTKTPDVRDTPHGEEEPEAPFGPGGDADNPYVTPEQAKELANIPVASKKPPTPKEIEGREETGGTGNKGAVGSSEAGLLDQDQVGAGYTGDGEEKGNRLKRLYALLKRRWKRSLVTSLAIGALGGGIASFSIASGPLTVIFVGATLEKAFSHQDNASNSRMGGLLRYARTGDIGEARIGPLQSKLRKYALKRLDRNGIRLITDSVTGQLQGIRIDHQRNPTYNGLSEEEARARIAKDNGIPIEKVFKVSGTGGLDHKGAVFSFKAQDASIKTGRSWIKTSYGSAKFGATAKAITFRSVATASGRPSMFHPWKRLKFNLEQRAVDASRTREANRQKSATERSPEAKSRAAKIKDKLGKSTGFRRTASVALGLQLGVCLARDIASEVPALNRENIANPAGGLAGDGIGQKNQVQSGDDFTSDQPGAAVHNYPDKNGKTIFLSMPFQAFEGKTTLTGEDLPDEYKQAFAESSSSNAVVDVLDKAGASQICSTVGQIVKAGLGIVLIATGPGGTFVQKAVSGGASIIAGAAVINALRTLIPKVISEVTPPVTTLTGPLGGSLAAYGARELNNMSSRSLAGVALSDQQSKILAENQDLLDKEDLNSKSFAERLLSPYYGNSLMANVISSQATSPIQDFNKLSSILSTPAKIINNFSGLFFPKALAATHKQVYDWGGFKEMGYSLDELNNPSYQDTGQNAHMVATTLNKLSSDDLDKVVKRVSSCFGDSLEKGSEGWDVKIVSDVNPASEDYQKANCADRSNDEWIRLRFFIFDTLLAKGAVCYEGDDEVCKEFGFGSGGASQPAPTPGGDLEANKDKFTDILTLPHNTIGPSAIGFYNQCSDSRWANKPYPYASGGSNTICQSACGPSSLAMVISTLGSQIINPGEMALLAKPYHVSGGTSMSGAIKLVEDYGLKQNKINENYGAEIKKVLQNGGFVIMNANPASPFTQAGHFIVIRAISTDGSKFYVADPADDNSNGQNRSFKAWPVSSLSGWLGPDGLYGVEK